MRIKKNKIEKYFLILISFLIATFILHSIFQHIKKQSLINELIKSIEISVIDVGYTQLKLSDRKETYTPAIIIELENKAKKAIKNIHIRALFNSEEKKLCLVSYDLIVLKPEEKRKIFLKCTGKEFLSPYRGGIIRNASYTLNIFPEDKTMQPIKGGFKFN